MKKVMAVLGVLLLLAGWLLWGNTGLTVAEYTISSESIPPAFSGFRIAQISDLHNTVFGRENRRLLDRIKKTEPDIIVITGDMVDYFHTDILVALAFARDAVKIAPVYYVTGNHEYAVGHVDTLRKQLEALGVCVLIDEKTVLEREGERITLLGVRDPGRKYDTLTQALEELRHQDDGYTILLSHRPEAFDTYVSAGVDLVFSGHAHGGQIRVPFIGGLYAPAEGWLPEYDAGCFTEGRTSMIVSRGLGNSRFPLRVNNPPEIVVAELNNPF